MTWTISNLRVLSLFHSDCCIILRAKDSCEKQWRVFQRLQTFYNLRTRNEERERAMNAAKRRELAAEADALRQAALCSVCVSTICTLFVVVVVPAVFTYTRSIEIVLGDEAAFCRHRVATLDAEYAGLYAANPQSLQRVERAIQVAPSRRGSGPQTTKHKLSQARNDRETRCEATGDCRRAAPAAMGRRSSAATRDLSSPTVATKRCHLRPPTDRRQRLRHHLHRQRRRHRRHHRRRRRRRSALATLALRGEEE